MTKDDSKPGGLFSKVVRFVRHPTVGWSELDALADDPSAGPDKQALRQMLERKRRNDFVRQREFDQLRRLRQKAALSAGGAPAPAEAVSLVSGFHSSLTSADARAVTVQKIDAIEEQMSQQWWRNKQPADASTLAMELVPALPQADSVRVAEACGMPVGPVSIPLAFAATVPLDWSAEATTSVTPAWEMPQRPLLGAERAAMATTFAATQQRDMPAWGAALQPAPLWEHDPDFEEAAIAFANGDVAGAEAALLELLAQRAAQPDAQQPVWQALFDLCRAAGLAERFEVLAIDFAAQMGRSAPLWFSLPAQLGLSGQAPATELAARAWRWTAPAVVTRQSVAALQAGKERASAPWTLVWTALERIEADAMPLLERVVTEWAQTPGSIQFLDAQVLVQYLQAQTVSGSREAGVDGWRLRMAVLRLMEQHDSFELAALDYCVTFEVSPPSWTPPRSSYVDGSPVDTAPADAAAADAAPVDTAAADATPVDTAPAGAESTPQALPVSHRMGTGLAGCIDSDAAPWLEALEAQARPGVPLVVDCSQLIRLDFAAAGSVLNWSADMQARGHALCFDRLHQLVAVFFGMIGISEHARLVPRSD